MQLFFSDRDPRPFYTRRAQLMDFVLARAGSPVDAHFAPRQRHQKRLRLGVYLRSIRPHSEVFATLPVFTGLEREEFDVRLFVLRRTNDPLEHYARQNADSLTVLPEDMKSSIELLRRADLDILFFGNNITAGCTQEVILAHHRIARRQGVHFCSPGLVGIPPHRLLPGRGVDRRQTPGRVRVLGSPADHQGVGHLFRPDAATRNQTTRRVP